LNIDEIGNKFDKQHEETPEPDGIPVPRPNPEPEIVG